MKNTPEDIAKARHAFVVTMIVATIIWVFLASAANAQQWRETDIPVYYNHTDNPYSFVDVTNAIKYASWIAEKRTGAVSHYAGSNGLIEPVKDTAQVIWDYPASGAVGSASHWIYSNDGLRSRSLVRLNPDRVKDYCLEYVTVHEIAHAMSMGGHVSQYGELMNTTTPATCDGALGQLSANLSAYDGGDRCFVELLPSGDLFVPDIGGMSAYLFQLTHTQYEWYLGYYYPNGGDGSCDTVSMDGNDIIMTDVQGYPGTQFTLVELENTAPDTWVLRYAE